MDAITEKVYQAILSVVLAAFGYLFGGWHYLMGVFIALWFLDYVTGMIASGINGELSSKRGFKGIGKKVMAVCVIATAHLADVLLGTETILRDATLFFFSMNEIISIIENAERAGLPLPSQLRRLTAMYSDDKDGKKDTNKRG